MNKKLLQEEVLFSELKGGALIITHQNISALVLKYFEIDLESLFSRSPFITHESQDFSFVMPNDQETLTFEEPQALAKLEIRIPKKFEKTNLFIQIASEGSRSFQTYFSTLLQVKVLRNYGMVQVLDSAGKPLSKVYVKVFQKLKSQQVLFFKDGYTDLVGKFSYLSLNESLEQVEKFSIFVMSDELGRPQLFFIMFRIDNQGSRPAQHAGEVPTGRPAQG